MSSGHAPYLRHEKPSGFFRGKLSPLPGYAAESNTASGAMLKSRYGQTRQPDGQINPVKAIHSAFNTV